MDPLLLGLLRHALQLVAGVLVARGYMDSSAVDGVVGGALALGSAGWYAAGRLRGK